MINGTMMQRFHWYSPDDGTLWDRVAADADDLAAAGITALWLPPPTKGSGGADDRGYGAYDLWDLGEFDQKATVRTRYGTRDQFARAVVAAHAAGMQVYADAVLNHKNGADHTQQLDATPVDWDRRNEVTGPTRRIQAWTKFTFPGRGRRYSEMTWDARHFDAVSWDENAPDGEKGATLYRLKHKTFDTPVDRGHQNHDYLMCCDLDMDRDDVRGELVRWGRWMLTDLHIDGFRLDAVKHIRFFFFNQWLDELRVATGKEVFAVGEYWDDYDVRTLQRFQRHTQGRLCLFDTVLRYHFHQASHSPQGSYDMRYLLNATLTQLSPTHAVTYVENHDTQLGRDPGYVQEWFKPLAYAMILLREQGYPCIFECDYYGAAYHDNDCDYRIASHRFLIDRYLHARRRFAYGPQHDYFDHPNVIGWTRHGDADHPGGLAVLLSNACGGAKWMDVGHPHATYRDLTEHIGATVDTNEHGWGEFRCPGGQASVWVPADA